MSRDIYLDNAATTRVSHAVAKRVTEVMCVDYGNASSLHRRGVAATALVNQTKQQLNALVGGGPWHVIFTSGGTEANNLLVRSKVPRGKRNGAVISGVEHASVSDTCQALAADGVETVIVGGGRTGRVDVGDMLNAVTERTALVCINHVASELGTVQPVNEIATAVRRRYRRVHIHVDAVQAAAQLSRIDYDAAVDSITMSGHKMYAPQGIGALLLRPGQRIRPVFFGGDQQGGMRPGTLNMPGIAGMGEAAAQLAVHRLDGTHRLEALRNRLLKGIVSSRVRLLGDREGLAPGMATVAVEGVASEVFLHTLEKHGVLVSAGSACHATRTAPSPCFVDAGLRPTEGVVRFSLSWNTTDTEVDEAVRRFGVAYDELQHNRAGV